MSSYIDVPWNHSARALQLKLEIAPIKECLFITNGSIQDEQVCVLYKVD